MKHLLFNLPILIAGLIVLPACERSSDPIVTAEETIIHERPAWSPDGLTIAFSNRIIGGQGIYLVDSSGLNFRVLKAGEGLGLSWSPDSKWIVFSANGSLHKIKATGDSLTQWTSSANDHRPAWSPDGTRIVFRNNGLRILNVATSQVTTILTTGTDPTWTPAGLILFITSSPAGASLDYFFETIDTTGGQRQTLYQLRTPADCGFSSVDQTGTYLLFSARPLDRPDRAQIVRITLSNSQGLQLTSDGGDFPAWSPDGTNIVYTRTAKDDGGLWIMNADGSNKRMLTQP